MVKVYLLLTLYWFLSVKMQEKAVFEFVKKTSK